MELSGKGQCTFTNAGKAEGSVCGTIFVEQRVRGDERDVESGIICSENVPPGGSVKKDFGILGATKVCQPKGSEPWTDVCLYEFIEKDDTVALRRRLDRVKTKLDRKKAELKEMCLQKCGPTGLTPTSADAGPNAAKDCAEICGPDAG